MTVYKIAMVLLMLVANGLFAAFEMAIASVSRARLVVLANQKKPGAAAALAMKNRMEASLAVVQVGITLAGTIAAAVGGAGIEETLSPSLAKALGLSDNMADLVAIAAFVLPLSAITIVFGELVPKMTAIRNPERVCLKMAPTMRVLAAVMYPVVALLEKVVKVVMAGGRRLAGDGDGNRDSAGLHELHAAAAMARTARLIGAREEKIVLSAAQLQSRPIGSIMVPVDSVATLSADSTLADSLIIAHLDLHTRFPVCAQQHDPQTILGYVTFKDLVVALRMESATGRVKSITRPIGRFPQSESIAQVLESMMRERLHIALVESAQKTVVGMVTLEDIMEELVGEIEDEYDRLPNHMHQTDAGWITGGGARMESVLSAMRLAVDALAPDAKALSVADWCVRLLGRPVEKGETIRWNGLVFHVRKLRRQKIAECFIAREKQAAVPAAPTA